MSEVLEARKHPFDAVPPAIPSCVESIRLVAIGPVCNHGPYPSPLSPSPPAIGVIRLIGRGMAGIGKVPGEHRGPGNIGALAGRRTDGERSAETVAYGANLGVPAPYGTAQGMAKTQPGRSHSVWDRSGGTVKPKYSPDPNPIEMAFSKLKARLRKPKARTFDAFWSASGNICDLFQPQEFGNSLKRQDMFPTNRPMF